MMEKAKRKYSIPVLQSCFNLLEYLSRYPGGAILTEIAEAGKIPVATAYRLSVVLEGMGYLERDSESRRIRLTNKLLLLGQRAVIERGLLEQALDVMRRLRDDVTSTVLIGVRDGGSVIVLEQMTGTQMFCFVAQLGFRVCLHSSAPGKAVWAFLPDAEREALLGSLTFPRHTPRTLTTRRKIADELELTRRRGFAVDDGEDYVGVCCVAAPIIDKSGYPLAAVWTTSFEDEIKRTGIDRIGARVKAAAEEISSRLNSGSPQSRRTTTVNGVTFTGTMGNGLIRWIGRGHS